jgi:hypothetical protein
MTKFDPSQIKPIPGFDSLKWKREVQAKIYEETKHMTPQEQRERTRRLLEKDELWREAYAKADAVAVAQSK